MNTRLLVALIVGLLAMSASQASIITWELKDVTVVHRASGHTVSFEGSFLYDDSLSVYTGAITEVCIHSTGDPGCSVPADSVFTVPPSSGCLADWCGSAWLELINQARDSSFIINFFSVQQVMDNNSLLDVPIRVLYVPVDLSDANRYGHVDDEAKLVARKAVPEPGIFSLMCLGLVLPVVWRSKLLTR